MARDGKVEQLAKVSLFRGLFHKELQAVGAAADIVAIPADNDVVVEGTPGHDFHLILNGTASVRRDGHKVVTLGTGESFGELALLTHAPRNGTVVAATDTELLVIRPAPVPRGARHRPGHGLQALGHDGRAPGGTGPPHQQPLTARP